MDVVILSTEMATRDYYTKQLILLFGLLLMVFAIRVMGIRTKKFTEPKFREVGHNVTVNRGETAVLKCLVDNLGPKTVVWRRESKDYVLSIGRMMYAPNEEMSIDHRKFPRDRTQWDLIIKRAQPEHSGTYECQISAAKVYTYHVELIVLDEPKKYNQAIELHGTEYVSRFSRISLTCNATGATRAPDDIDWFHKGQKININDIEKWQDRLSILTFQPDIPGKSLISQLLIERSQRDDSGTYICRSADLSMKSIVVHVLNADKDITKREDDSNEKPLSQSFNKSNSVYVSKFAWIFLMISLSITLYVER